MKIKVFMRRSKIIHSLHACVCVCAAEEDGENQLE